MYDIFQYIIYLNLYLNVLVDVVRRITDTEITVLNISKMFSARKRVPKWKILIYSFPKYLAAKGVDPGEGVTDSDPTVNQKKTRPGNDLLQKQEPGLKKSRNIKF